MFRSKIFTILVLLGLITSCKKEKEQNPEPTSTNQPTPYKFNIPNWVIAKVGYLPEPTDNLTTNEGVLLGRKLFFDKRLSGNNSMSCATCHSPSTSFAETADFTIPEGGRVPMAIINLAWSDKLFWDGRSNSLEAQAHDPVTNPSEMHNTWPEVERRLQQDPVYPDLFYKAFGTKTVDSILVTKAIAQFERTLVSFNSRYDQFLFEGNENAFTASELRGYQLFITDAGCSGCHTEVLLTDNSFRNIGLSNIHYDKGLGGINQQISDEGKFKVTTLRNVALTAPYMHDGRFNSLETVIDHYDHGVQPNSPNLEQENIYSIPKGLQLTIQQKDDLLNFLHTFTDSSFITNPAFQDPNLQ